jgi:hypothetical protein
MKDKRNSTPPMRTCAKCGETKILDMAFRINFNREDGYRSMICVGCERNTQATSPPLAGLRQPLGGGAEKKPA